MYTKMSCFLPAAVLFLAAFCFTADVNGKDKKKVVCPPVIVEDYKSYKVSPTVKDFAKFDKKAGVSKGQGALVMTRPEKSVIYKVVSNDVPLAPKQEYEVTVWVKGTGLKYKNTGKGIAFVAIEYEKDGHYASGVFPKFDFAESDFKWKEFKFRFTTKADFDKAKISFFLQRDITGTLSIGGYTIEKAVQKAQ